MATAVKQKQRILAFIRLGRPHFLLGGFVMHALGVSAALWAGASLNVAVLVLGQLAITATQWMVHYANDYFDRCADSGNRTPIIWSGGSRILAQEQLKPWVAYLAALGLALIAVLAALGLVLIYGVGLAAAGLIALALFLSWGYSAPPFHWHSRGIGEAVSALVVTVLTPALGFYLQAGSLSPWLFLVSWPVFCFQLCFQISINFPDAAADEPCGKYTLVVRRPAAAARLYTVALLSAYAAMPLASAAGLPPLVVLAPLCVAPAAACLGSWAARGLLNNPRWWARISTGSLALALLTAALQTAGFILRRP